jgi:hypothetical protein
MLKRILDRLRKRSFANNVLLHCNSLIYELIDDDKDNTSRKYIQEDIKNNCFDVIRKRGPQETGAFRKSLVGKVLGIVQSDNPIISMRKELICLIHSTVLNCMFFSEKFANRRNELYGILNKYMDKDQLLNSDDTASVIYFWSEAEIIILRMLHIQYFEKVEKDDWYSTYSKVYNMYMEMVFESMLSDIDNSQQPMDSTLLPSLKSQLEIYQKNLIGEVLWS